MGKSRVVAETGAGQHGVATAAAAARLGLPCRVYMGTVDMARQAPNVTRMRLFGAEVVGVDNSPEMIGAARTAGQRPRLSFELGDLREWRPSRPVDVLVCNAVLQWVPGHLAVIRRWPDLLAPGGWLAIQLPGNYDQPSHAILLDLVRSPRWQPLLASAELNRQAHDPAEYLDVFVQAGCEADAWETTYLHVLAGPDAVTEWYRGTGLRPVLAALDPGPAAEFLAEYGERARAAYPARPSGTVLPFRRVFAVAHKR